MVSMKKVFAIQFACLILLSGMHFTVATHYCGGKIAATKVSFSGKAASCGMVNDVHVFTETSISTRCCENEISVFAVENNYAPSVFHVKDIAQLVLQIFYLPVGTFNSNCPPIAIHTNVSPPGFHAASAVSMADICVFRI